MHLFHKIEGAVAILRGKGGIYRQVDVYHRGRAIFVRCGSGFLKVTSAFGGRWGTSNPDTFVEGIDGGGLIHFGTSDVPLYVPPEK